MSRQREWAKKQVALGNCAQCGKKREGKNKNFCVPCAKKQAERSRARRNCKPWVKGKRGRPPLDP